MRENNIGYIHLANSLVEIYLTFHLVDLIDRKLEDPAFTILRSGLLP